jgi:UDP-glucose 4-epimerase
MKCVVLGGAGFLGSHLTDALLAAGYEVRVFDRPNVTRAKAVTQSHEVEWIEGDFLNKKDLAAALAGCDIVYHLVSTTLPKTSNDNRLYDLETNVAGTLTLLELVKASRPPMKVVFVSSGGTIYGIPREVPIKESHPTDPICAYGIAKLAIEKYLHLYHVLDGIEYRVLRLANPYGEGQRTTSGQGIVTVCLDKVLRGEPIEIWGDGRVVRDYLYVGDAMLAFIKVTLYSGPHRVFNIGSGEGKSILEVLSAVEEVAGRRLSRRMLSGRDFDVPANVLDISRAREHLGWEPRTTLHQGLERTFTWLLAH